MNLKQIIFLILTLIVWLTAILLWYEQLSPMDRNLFWLFLIYGGLIFTVLSGILLTIFVFLKLGER